MRRTVARARRTLSSRCRAVAIARGAARLMPRLGARIIAARCRALLTPRARAAEGSACDALRVESRSRRGAQGRTGLLGTVAGLSDSSTLHTEPHW